MRCAEGRPCARGRGAGPSGKAGRAVQPRMGNPRSRRCRRSARGARNALETISSPPSHAFPVRARSHPRKGMGTNVEKSCERKMPQKARARDPHPLGARARSDIFCRERARPVAPLDANPHSSGPKASQSVARPESRQSPNFPRSAVSHPKPPVFLFAHGAGASSESAWMKRYAERLRQVGVVVPFDYSYMREGRRAPDRLPRLIETHRAELASVRTKYAGHPIFLAGKSMGGRVGCHVALEEDVRGVVCFGYPLVGQNGALRDQVLRTIASPVLFIQGTRDRLCPLDLLEEVRRGMQVRSQLHVVDGGDHSLGVSARALKTQATTQESVESYVVSSVEEFVQASR